MPADGQAADLTGGYFAPFTAAEQSIYRSRRVVEHPPNRHLTVEISWAPIDKCAGGQVAGGPESFPPAHLSIGV
jgi:hypothetical protein